MLLLASYVSILLIYVTYKINVIHHSIFHNTIKCTTHLSNLSSRTLTEVNYIIIIPYRQ